MKFYIGQRVIIYGDEIGTVERAPAGRETEPGFVWVKPHSRSYESQFAEHNVKPLPINAQL